MENVDYTKPNPDFISRISKYLKHRAETLEHLKKKQMLSSNTDWGR